MDQKNPPRRPGRPPVTNVLPGEGEAVEPGIIRGRVVDLGGTYGPIKNARITITESDGRVSHRESDADGRFEALVAPGSTTVEAEAFGASATYTVPDVRSTCRSDVDLRPDVGLALGFTVTGENCEPVPCTEPTAGTIVTIQATHHLTEAQLSDHPLTFNWLVSRGVVIEPQNQRGDEIHLDTSGAAGRVQVTLTIRETGSPSLTTATSFFVNTRPAQPVTGSLSVGLRRTASTVTNDLALWLVIKASTDALSFRNYQRFMDVVLCGVDPATEGLFDEFELEKIIGTGGKRAKYLELRDRRTLPFIDADAYRLLKAATEAFLTVNCGVFLKTFPFDEAAVRELVATTSIESIDVSTMADLWDRYLVSVNGTEHVTLPYLGSIAAKFPELRLKNSIFTNVPGGLTGADTDSCFGLLTTKLTEPCLLELIWSYWHEEGMLAQTLNAISVRFQNRRGADRLDPLANVEIDPLRPLNNLLWGYIQDEQHRLTVLRRAYEYDHHYGIRLHGRAVPEMRTADSRSQFLRAFHNLLHKCVIFFQQDDDTTVISDGFPVLNALKEVHLILSQGAHNQFGDLPFTARVEMLMQQWLLARPEFREFLPTRIMVAYPEPWMDRVDAMKKLQGWSDVNVLHFRDLGVFGEKLLLSIRFGNWVDAQVHDQAKNWARLWRTEISGYIHAYRAVTGVDISVEPVNVTQPSVLLRERLSQQRLRA